MKRARINTPTQVEWSSEAEQYIASLPLEVSRVPSSPLHRSTATFHEPIINRLISEGKLRRDDLHHGKTFLHRLMVNFIRHNHVNAVEPRKYRFYRLLKDAEKIYDPERVYWALHNRILDEIVNRNPQLSDACEVQRREILIEPEDIFRIYLRDDVAPISDE